MLLSKTVLRHAVKSKYVLSFRQNSSAKARKHHEPLNILFCGSDEFSIYSLRALHALQKDNPGTVARLDVLCRPDKRVGRGLKQIQQVPIKQVANDLGLKLHQIDTFRGWACPESINLVVAVSFGLLVPSRILSAAKYGGLNVHPSLLPDLRGPAPIIQALLKRRPHTGVTLQTMHPTKFDHGAIVAQTASPGVPILTECTPSDLLGVLGSLGADILCQSIQHGTFVPPINEVRSGWTNSTDIAYAPKITPEDRKIDWTKWTSDEIRLRDRVLGRLWDDETYSTCFPGRPWKRITYHGPWNTAANNGESAQPGQVKVITNNSSSASVGIATVDHKFVAPQSVTIEGEGKGKGIPALLEGLRAIGHGAGLA